MNTTSPGALRQTIWQLLQAHDQAAVQKAAELTGLLPLPGDEPDEQTAQCIFDTGFALESFADDNAAVELYRRVLRYPVVDTKYIASAWFRIGVCLCRQGNLAEAITCYRESVPLAIHQPHLISLAYFSLAGLLEAAEDYEEAAELYGKLLPMLPHPDINTQRVRLGYARCCWRLGREETAIRELAPLADNPDEPVSAEALRLLAEIAEARKDFASAEKIYRQLIVNPHAETSLRAAAAYRLTAASDQSPKKRRIGSLT